MLAHLKKHLAEILALPPAATSGLWTGEAGAEDGDLDDGCQQASDDPGPATCRRQRPLSRDGGSSGFVPYGEQEHDGSHTAEVGKGRIRSQSCWVKQSRDGVDQGSAQVDCVEHSGVAAPTRVGTPNVPASKLIQSTRAEQESEHVHNDAQGDQRDGEDVRDWHTLDEDDPVTIAEQRRHSQVTGNHKERLYAEGPEEEAQMDLLPGNKASEPESDETQHQLHTAPGCGNDFHFPESYPNQADIEADAGQARGMQAEEQGEQAMP